MLDIVLLITVEMLKKRLGIEAIERDWSNGCINWYFKVPTTIIIPEIIEKIGSWSFEMCPWLKKVTIPESVKIIGKGAFSGCRKLEKAVIPKDVIEIGARAFQSCESLKKVIIPESCKRIGDWAFADCGTLKKVVIPKSVEWIGDYAFEWCWKAIIILKKRKKDFEHIGNSAFSGCKVC